MNDIKRDKYSQESVGRRHRTRDREQTESKRDEIRKRNRQQTVQGVKTEQELLFIMKQTVIEDLFGTNYELPLNNLARILSSGRLAHPYFGPSSLYPECTGPFLFSDARILPRLIQLYEQDEIKAAECLINVAGHPEQGKWVCTLEQCGIVPAIGFKVTTPQTPEEVICCSWWILSNMACDNAQTRNGILESGAIPWMQQQNLEKPEILRELVLFTKTLFDRTPVPDQQLALQLAPVAFRAMQSSDEETLSFLGFLLVNWLRHLTVEFHQWFVGNETWMQFVVKKAEELPIFTQVLSKLCYHTILQETLINRYQVLTILSKLIDQHDMNTRIHAIQGLNFLADNPQVVHFMVQPAILQKVTSQFVQTDIWRFRRELFGFLHAILSSATRLEPYTARQLVHSLPLTVVIGLLNDELLAAELEPNLLHGCLVSLRVVFMQERATTHVFQDLGGVERLERLFSYPNPVVRSAAEQLVDQYFP